MMKYRLFFSTLAGLLGLCVLTAGCEDMLNEGQGDAGKPGESATPDSCWGQFDQTQSSGFQKPGCESFGERKFARTEEWARDASRGAGVTESVNGRPYMRSTRRARESWLFSGEPFVLDGFYLTYGDRSNNYSVVVVIGKEQVPFKLFRVDDPDGYPSLEEIKNLEPSTLSTTASLNLPDNQPVNVTLAVPPESFPGEGRFNLRVLLIPDSEFETDRPVVRDRFPFHTTHTVYYGSEDPVGLKQQVEVREPRAVWWDKIERNWVASLAGMFLTPSDEIYDVSQYEHFMDVNLKQQFQVSGRRTTLYLHAAGVEGMDTNTTGENLYLVFRDANLIDAFRGTPYTLSHSEVGEFTGSEEDVEGTMFPLDVELTSEPALYQVIAFPFPFEVQYQSVLARARASNFLRLQGAPAP